MTPLWSQLLVGVPLLALGFGGLVLLLLDDIDALLRVWRRRNELDELWRDDEEPVELRLVEGGRA